MLRRRGGSSSVG